MLPERLATIGSRRLVMAVAGSFPRGVVEGAAVERRVR